MRKFMIKTMIKVFSETRIRHAVQSMKKIMQKAATVKRWDHKPGTLRLHIKSQVDFALRMQPCHCNLDSAPKHISRNWTLFFFVLKYTKVLIHICLCVWNTSVKEMAFCSRSMNVFSEYGRTIMSRTKNPI